MTFLKTTMLSAVLALIFSGCVESKPTPSKETKVDPTLPVVTLTKSATIADTNAIALEWESLSDPRVNGIYIYRRISDANGTKQEDGYYETINNRFSTHFLDTRVQPNTAYSYAFKTYSHNAISTQSAPVFVRSLPQMDSVAWIHSVTDMPRSAKILWRPHTNQKVKGYILQRKTLEEGGWEDVATIEGRLSVEYIDTKLKDKFTYKYRIVALTYDFQTSKPSEEVGVTTKALPKEIQNIQATQNLPKKIEVKWEKSDAPDFLTYRVYRSTSATGSFSMVAETQNNSFVDAVNEDAKEYFYRVSAYDKDKLASINVNHTAMGKSLVKPTTPSVVEAKLQKDSIRVSWSNQDKRVKSFTVKKSLKKSFIESVNEDFVGVVGSEFIDNEIAAKQKYYYRVVAVDEFGIESLPSIEVMVETAEGFKGSNAQNSYKKSEPAKSAPAEDNSDKSVVTPIKDI